MNRAAYLDEWTPRIGADAASAWLRQKRLTWQITVLGVVWTFVFVLGLGLGRWPIVVVAIVLAIVNCWLGCQAFRDWRLVRILARQHVGITWRVPIPMDNASEFDRWLDGQRRRGKIPVPDDYDPTAPAG